ncbi:2TM domain-containing protein [Tamlana sp. 2_MG-2023]|uniref:2TM domain-containing protein n=1 Tax=unclassified Tamlana TaxID=2614803 RepID=UPI0026E235D3|nr:MULTISPECIES: 2TM domain-containing protein [unclassified Tamlana]MDO6758668.1 2TM domain-containing protein [Tamlana sp. 2_MG-2023]MDO6789367.1 2TM domain-containing protein [Tamlana sp. 1_MG-2023]
METEEKKHQLYIEAKKKVKDLKIFYIHFVGYLIVVLLLCYNLYIMSGPHKPFFQWFDISILVGWTIFISYHAWNVFKGRLFFKKRWEDEKLRKFMDAENQTSRWE